MFSKIHDPTLTINDTNLSLHSIPILSIAIAIGAVKLNI